MDDSKSFVYTRTTTDSGEDIDARTGSVRHISLHATSDVVMPNQAWRIHVKEMIQSEHLATRLPAITPDFARPSLLVFWTDVDWVW